MQLKEERMSNFFKVEISPGMGVYRQHQNYPYSVQTALAEFIDNSVQSYIDNQKAISIVDKEEKNLKIKISINSQTKEISIIDNAGGVNRDNFPKAVKLGTDAEYPEKSLSKFGLGMKTAANWFSGIWKIETSALYSTDKLTSEFNLDELERKGEKRITVFVGKEEAKKHYTKISIKKSLRMEPKKHYEEKVISHLKETFINFKDFLEIEIKYDGVMLESKRKGKATKGYFEPFEILDCPVLSHNKKPINNKTKVWKRRIELSYGDRSARGHFIIMKKGSYLQPGIRLFRNRRVIEGTLISPNKPEAIFETAVNKYAGFRLYGEFHLENFELDFMKTQFTKIDPLYQDLKKELQKDPSFIDQVKFYRAKAETEKPETEDSLDKEKPIIIKKSSGETRKKSRISNNITKIQPSEEIKSKLSELENKKLLSLYNSLCILSLKEHPYLCYVGSWAFLEILSVSMGKNEKPGFDAFFGNKLNTWYDKQKQEKKRMHDAVQQIHTKGNFAKHDFKYEFADAKQLHNEFKVLEEFIVKCIDRIKEN